MKKNILVVSVHPDDETLGCGGSLLKFKKQGHDIFCIYPTNGNKNQEEIIPVINMEFGFKKTFNLNFSELEIDDISLNKLIPAIADAINEIKPDIIFVPNRSDVHSDHRQIFKALIATTKSFRFPFIKKILMYEVISETDFAPALPENVFQPNVFVDISEEFEQKLKIYSNFKSELLAEPLTRSIQALKAYNKYRGSLINAEYAEAFVLLKEII
ncbi:MAG: PIG-L deacetylase family protein [Bacteroidales bacterium]|jgi:LmbE family N-acetylglucosaminyl deacetylase|nr:PIG-L deacetylase family protein [Bacteroidales bacterium]